MNDKRTLHGRTTVASLIIRHCLDLMENHKVASAPILASAGLTVEQLGNLSDRVPLPLAELMIETAVRQSGNAMLGIHLSQSSFPVQHELLGFIRQACNTLHGLLETIDRFEHLLSDAITSAILPDPGGATWTFDFHCVSPLVRKQVTDFSLGFRYEFLDTFDMPRSSIVSAVRLTSKTPANENELAAYQRRFDCPVLFNQPHNGIVLTMAGLNHPIRANHRGWPVTGSLSVSNEAADTVGWVRTALRRLIADGCPTRDNLADMLGTSSRQLHRELAHAGTGYRELFDEVRLEMAQDYLQNTQMQLNEIAERLCFREGPSFIRWFRQHQKTTPGAYRESLSADVDMG